MTRADLAHPPWWRLPACLLIAAAAHAAVVLGIDLPAAPEGAPGSRPIELLLTSPQPAASPVPGEPAVAAREPPAAAESAPAPLPVSVPPPQPSPVPPPQPSPVPPRQPRLAPPDQEATPPLAGRTASELVRGVAALATRTGTRRDSRRVARIASGMALDPDEAFYLESWRRKVERIGRLNYPSEARSRRVTGSLRLLVVIEPDGSLEEVRVIDSSGHPVLDGAAVRIVRLAAPYAPFPPAMRARLDVLEIERTWRFRGTGPVSAGPS